MIINITKFIQSFSTAVDYLEHEFVDIRPYHGRRVAVLANRMGKAAGLDADELYGMTQGALLHDCALSEYLKDENVNDKLPGLERVYSAHCLAGEKMLSVLPLYSAAAGTVLYHHERADGTGALGKPAGEVPLRAQLVHLADMLDVEFSFFDGGDRFAEAAAWVKENTGTMFSPESAELFAGAVDAELLNSLAGDNCKAMLDSLEQDVSIDIPTSTLVEMSRLFAQITDYKSPFTRRHSMGIAEKARRMGEYYGYAGEEADKLYIAGALHDVGKLLVTNDILEKPGKLTPDEYKTIQNHAMGTWNLLYGIDGMEDITSWAANHHEKLDGSGYPYGKKADELGRNERLLACLDIYQALVEDRPYKKGFSHEDSMGILRKMGNEGQLDAGIIDDIDRCFSPAAEDKSGDSVNAEGKADEEKPAERRSGWRCPVCGYFYEGEELPESFICPDCEQPGSMFSFEEGR